MAGNKAWGAGGSGSGSLSPLEQRLIEEWTNNIVTYYGDPDTPLEGDVKIILEAGDLNGYRYESAVWVLKSTLVGDSIYTDRFVCVGDLFKGLYNGEDSMVRLATTLAKTLVTGDTDYNQVLTGVGDLLWVESDGVLEHSIPQPLFDEEVTTDFMEFCTDPSEYEKVIQSKFMVTHATATEVKMRWTAHLDVAKTNLIYESCTEFDYNNAIGQCMLDITTGLFFIEKPLYLSDLGGAKVYYTIYTEFPITYKGHTVDPGGANEQYYPYNEQWDYNAVGKIVAMQDWVDEYSVMKDDTDTTEMQFVSTNPDLDVDPTLLGTREVLKQYIDNAVSASLEYKGGYDASLNIPNLTIAPTGVLLGYFYTVTVAGTFFTADVLVGDALIAEVDDPSVEADWTILNRGLDAPTVKTLYESNPDTNAFQDAEKTKLGTVETNAEPNNISDISATDLTDLGDTALHYHSTDRARVNHTGTQTASTISDFDTEVSNNTSVADNTTHRSSDGKDHSDVVTNNAKVSFPEAPIDGERKTRLDGAWVAESIALTDEPTGFLLDATTGEIDLESSELLFVDGTRTFTIQPKNPATEFSIIQSGKLSTFNSAQDIIISDTEGVHYIYFKEGILYETTAFDISIIYSNVFVSALYWDVPNQEAIYIGEERHGCKMDGHTHTRLHQKDGTIYLIGLGINDFDLGNGSQDVHAQFSIGSGQIKDEDILITRDTISSTVGCPIFYKSGATGIWRREFNAGFSVLNALAGNNRLVWNEDVAGTWQKTEVANNDYVLCHIFTSNDINYPFFAIMGQADYDKKGDAREGALVEINNLIMAGLPFAEFVATGTVIFKTADGYTNAVKAKIETTDEGEDYVDWRNSGISPSSGTDVIQHNLTAGKQGGTINEYYHLTDLELVKLTGIEDGAQVNVYGTEFERVESLSESSTNTTQLDKIDMTSAMKPAGTYLVTANFQITNDRSGKEAVGIVTINGVVAHHHTEGINGIVHMPWNGKEWITAMVMMTVVLPAPATIPAKISYYSGSSDLCRISDASITIIRVT
jgi:hypothetical protein